MYSTGVALYVLKKQKNARENRLRQQMKEQKMRSKIEIPHPDVVPQIRAIGGVDDRAVGGAEGGAVGGAEPIAQGQKAPYTSFSNPAYRYQESILTPQISTTSEKSPRHAAFREIELTSGRGSSPISQILNPELGNSGIPSDKIYTGKRWIDLVSDDADTPDTQSVDQEYLTVTSQPLPQDPFYDLVPVATLHQTMAAGDPIPLIAALSKEHALFMEEATRAADSPDDNHELVACGGDDCNKQEDGMLEVTYPRPTTESKVTSSSLC